MQISWDHTWQFDTTFDIYCYIHTGDLLTALLLAKLYQQPDNMQHAVEHAIASLQGVLLATVDAAGEAAHAKERTPAVSNKAQCHGTIPCRHVL